MSATARPKKVTLKPATPPERVDVDIEPRRPAPQPLLYSTDDVTRVICVSKPTLWRMTKARRFPLPIRLGPHRVAWLVREVEDWIQEQARKRAS